MTRTLNQKIQAFRPQVEKLIRKIESNDEGEQAFVTGFIFARNKAGEQGLVKFGNIDNKGPNFVRMHATLSLVASDFESGINYPGVHFTEISNSAGGDVCESSADELAQAVLTFAGEPAYVAKLIDIAHKYLKARGEK